MNPSRHSLLALGVVLAGVFAASGASAQTNNNDQQYQLQPFLPPNLILPPNAQLNPGSLTTATPPHSSAPPSFDSSPTEPPRAPGLTITIPATTR